MSVYEQTFLNKSIRKFGILRFSILDYNFDISNDRKVKIICSKHGEFVISAKQHLKHKSGGCSGCLKDSRSGELKIKYEKVLAQKLGENIILPEYYSTKIIKLICKNHGEFTKRLHDAVRGQSCPECSNNSFEAFSKSQFLENFKKTGKSILYVLRCYNREEDFIKVGITTKSVEDRYKSKSSMPYRYEILNIYCGEPEDVWDLEKFIQKCLRKHFKYKPEIMFKGSKYECYKF